MPKSRKKQGLFEDYDDENIEIGGKASILGLSAGGYLETRIKRDLRDWLWWIKFIGLVLFGLSAIGYGLNYNWNKQVIVTHSMSLRDEHDVACNALLTANGNLLDDDDSDDFCLWREHQYNITWPLLVTISLCINTVILLLGYFNWGFFFADTDMHDDHHIKLDNNNNESIYYFKATYQWWWWLSVSAMLANFSAYHLTIACIFGVLYALSLALTQQSNKGFKKKNLSDTTASNLFYYFSPYKNVLAGPIFSFIIFVFWITFLFVQFFEIFTSHTHHIDHYVTFIFIWELCFTASEYILEHFVQLYTQNKLIDDTINKKERKMIVQDFKYKWECFHWIHQEVYIIIGVWILCPLLLNTKYII